MPKTDINKILKKDFSNLHIVDYNSYDKRQELKELTVQRELAVKNKEVDWQRLGKFIIKI